MVRINDTNLSLSMHEMWKESAKEKPRAKMKCYMHSHCCVKFHSLWNKCEKVLWAIAVLGNDPFHAIAYIPSEHHTNTAPYENVYSFSLALFIYIFLCMMWFGALKQHGYRKPLSHCFKISHFFSLLCCRCFCSCRLRQQTLISSFNFRFWRK